MNKKISHDLKHALVAAGLEYANDVDARSDTSESADNLFHKRTGYSLRAKVEELFQQSGYFEQTSDKLDKEKTYDTTTHSLKSYERFKNGVHDQSTKVFEEENATCESGMKATASYIMYRTDAIAAKMEQNEERQKHVHYEKDVTKLKPGDVIQIYQPYEDNRLKNHVKNTVDQYGQNRYYAIMQPLPNGDFLAVDFRGHRQADPSDIDLQYDGKYAYPTSPHVQPRLNTYGHLLVQLPKEAIQKGTMLREKYEAASYGKVYDEMVPRSIKVLEMSPINQKKLQDFRKRFNQEQLDLGWSKTHEKVVGSSVVGRGAINPYFVENAKKALQQGTYESRSVMMTTVLERQAKIRKEKYGPNSKARIQSESQKQFVKAERKQNQQKYQGSGRTR